MAWTDMDFSDTGFHVSPPCHSWQRADPSVNLQAANRGLLANQGVPRGNADPARRALNGPRPSRRCRVACPALPAQSWFQTLAWRTGCGGSCAGWEGRRPGGHVVHWCSRAGGRGAVGSGGTVPGGRGGPATAPGCVRYSRGKLKLEYFKPNLLANTPGWDLAFAAAIDDLESAGLVLADLANAADAQLADRGDTSGPRWTSFRTSPGHKRGSSCGRPLSSQTGRAWPLPGPVLAAARGTRSASRAAFLCAIPNMTITLRLARPLRDEHCSA